MLRGSCLMPRLTPLFSFFTQCPHLFVCWSYRFTSSPLLYYHSSFMKGTRNKRSASCFNIDSIASLSTLAQITSSVDEVSKNTSNRISKKARRKAEKESPAGVLRQNLIWCSKDGDVVQALQLYDEARKNGVVLNLGHYNALLYLCSSSHSSNKRDIESSSCILKMGFEIFEKMLIEKVFPNEATFTSAARLAAAKEDPEMAYELVKQMKTFGIAPKLRSYEPALYGFCNRGDTEKAYEVDAGMIASGIIAEEPELSALLKVSAIAMKGDKVYEMLHRLRATVRHVSQSTLQIIEDWFNSEYAAKIGVKNWDVKTVTEGIVQGGGGWHGLGWLGTGQWKVVNTHIDETGQCLSCGEKLVSVDIDPKETENFATLLSRLAFQREVKVHFNHFQSWLQQHGPFDAVVDGANVGHVNMHKHFSFFQVLVICGC